MMKQDEQQKNAEDLERTDSILDELRDNIKNGSSFTVEAAGTVYTVNTHFDSASKSSVFDQLKRLLLKDPDI